MTVLAATPTRTPVAFTLPWSEEQIAEAVDRLYTTHLAGETSRPAYLPPVVVRRVWLKFLNERPQMTGEVEWQFRLAYETGNSIPAMTKVDSSSDDLRFRKFPERTELPPRRTVQEMVDETRAFLVSGKSTFVNLHLHQLHHEIPAEEVVQSPHVELSQKAKFLAISPTASRELVEEFLHEYPQVLIPEFASNDCNLIAHPYTPLELLAQQDTITWDKLLVKDPSGVKFFQAWQAGLVGWAALTSSTGNMGPLFDALQSLANHLPVEDLAEFLAGWETMKVEASFHAGSTSLPILAGLLGRSEPLTDMSIYENLIPEVGVLRLWQKTAQTTHLETMWGRLLRSREFHSNHELATLLRLLGGGVQAYEAGLGEVGAGQMRATFPEVADLPDRFLWEMFDATWLR